MEAPARTLTLTDSRARTALFVTFAVITLAPLTITHSQWLTGPLVNAMLLLTCALVGPMEAVILGLFPSVIALASGLLPLPLAPMLPFIMIGNAAYIAAFQYLRNRSTLGGIAAASILKFIFLAVSMRLLLSSLLPPAIVSKAALMMGWPQLATALLGGAIAFVLLSLFSRRG